MGSVDDKLFSSMIVMCLCLYPFDVGAVVELCESKASNLFEVQSSEDRLRVFLSSEHHDAAGVEEAVDASSNAEVHIAECEAIAVGGNAFSVIEVECSGFLYEGGISG
jgi:hypothetical protein